jgi:amidase
VGDFILYWAFLAMAQVRSGKRAFGPSIDRTRLDNLTLGLEAHAIRNLHRVPLAIARLSTLRRITARLYRTYDVLMMPTLADEPLRIGRLDPMADYSQIMDRLLDWVAFTPLQNVTGEPALSLPLAESATCLPIGIMFASALGQDATLLKLAYELEAVKPWPLIDSVAAN